MRRYQEIDPLELQEIVRAALEACADEDGKANLAKIGIYLRRQGVHYGKLSRFFAHQAGYVRTWLDETTSPPIAYARLQDQENLA